MQNLEVEVRRLMILQSQVNVSYLDLCVSGHLKQLKDLSLVYEDISNYLVRRITTGKAPFAVHELIEKRLIDIFGEEYVAALLARVKKAVEADKPQT